MEQNKQRKLRIYQSRRKTGLPLLQLEGLWLQELGFEMGDLIEVAPCKEGLTIKIVEKWKSGR